MRLLQKTKKFTPATAYLIIALTIIGYLFSVTMLVAEKDKAPVFYDQTEKSLTELYSKHYLSNVTIYIQPDDDMFGGAMGSGFFISPTLIGTALHVVENYETSTIRIVLNTPDKESHFAEVVRVIPEADTAVLRVINYVSPTFYKVNDGTKLFTGQKVFSISSVGDFDYFMSAGNITAPSRRTPYMEAEGMQMNIGTNPGMSGSAVLNADGEVIGILHACFAQNPFFGIFVPTVTYYSIFQELIETENIPNAD